MSEETRIVRGIEYWFTDDGEECQCARCGSSTSWLSCWDCSGMGGYDDDGWDGMDEVWATCDECHGAGGSQHCISGPEWCEAHPLPGRDNIQSTALKPEAWH